MAYIPVYVNDSGEMWIERYIAPWPRILREARGMASEMGNWGDVAIYQGLVTNARVSDEREEPHMDDDGCADSQGVDYNDPAFKPCCRTIEAHHFRAEER